ncbi:dihydroorotase [Variovorax sp. PBL-E5]|uniref:dihydroorotase n=1 Tax=Variovorax sp. PBL-E5 TaxID=434014 RepID=UPI001316C7C5|nr:amidohydrolase family protein [Variovorax sp. PBL-E5]VTU45371.1 D-phenylhydantoinase [Variovorax sp. PBL-E5]
MKFDCIVRNGIVVFPDRGEGRVDLGIVGGKIAAILEPGLPNTASETIDAAGKFVFPGLIDAHMHFGIAGSPDEYATETGASAQGGFTTVLGYLLNSVPYSETFPKQKALGESQAHIDFAYHFGMAKEEHLEEVPRYVEEFGVTSFKYFTNFKGDEGLYLGLTGADEGFMLDLMQAVARYPQAKLSIHPENIEIVRRTRAKLQREGKDSLRAWSESKPTINEALDTVKALYVAKQTHCSIYFVHVTSRLALDEIRAFRRHSNLVHAETCPQYLTHTMDSDIGSMGKANPPLKTADDVEALWEAIADGTIQVVGADHVARKKATKEKDIWQSSQGFPATPTILQVLLSEGYHKGRLSLQRIAQLLCKDPATIFGIGDFKGDIAIGYDADLTIVDLQMEKIMRAQDFVSFADYSLYDGWSLKGWPILTMVRGTTVMRDGALVGSPGHGRFIARKSTRID